MPIWPDLRSLIDYARVHDRYPVDISFQEGYLMIKIQDLAILESVSSPFSSLNLIQGEGPRISLYSIPKIGRLRVLLNRHIHKKLENGFISASAFIGVSRISHSLTLQFSSSRSAISID